MTSMSNKDINTALPELSIISNMLEQIQPTIDDANGNFTKQELEALKKLRENQSLVIRKAAKRTKIIIAVL